MPGLTLVHREHKGQINALMRTAQMPQHGRYLHVGQLPEGSDRRTVYEPPRDNTILIVVSTHRIHCHLESEDSVRERAVLVVSVF